MRSGVPANDPAMTTDSQCGELRRALHENRQLRAENDRLCADSERLRERLNDLEGKLEAALRVGKRQSAPFSREEPKANPGDGRACHLVGRHREFGAGGFHPLVVALNVGTGPAVINARSESKILIDPAGVAALSETPHMATMTKTSM
jgi:hypothetical protein